MHLLALPYIVPFGVVLCHLSPAGLQDSRQFGTAAPPILCVTLFLPDHSTIPLALLTAARRI